jgi:hypothetical protein
VEGVAENDEAAWAKSERLLEVLTQSLVQDFGVPATNIKEKK